MTIGQGVQVATIEDGTQINFVVAAGRLLRVGTDLATLEDVTPPNVTIDSTTRAYLTPFSNRMVVTDDVNTPWVASDLLATPVIGTKLDYSGTGAPWKAYGPARVWQGALEFVVRERDGEGAAVGVPEKRTTRWAWSEPDEPFLGYHQLADADTESSFDNEWDMVEASADPIYAMWPTNLANYYFRDGSIGYITGTIGPDLRTTATHDAVEEASGSRCPASMVAFGSTVFYVDVEGRVTSLKLGGGTTDIWKQHRRVVDEAQTRFPDITARVACASLVPELDLYLVAIWSPDPTNTTLVFPTTMYAFRADSGTYVGEWTIGPLDGDKVAVHAMGTLIGPNGEPRLVVLGKPSLAAADDPVRLYALYALDNEIWHDDDELPDIFITTHRIGYSANTVTNVDQATVIVKTVPDTVEEVDDVPASIVIAPTAITLAEGDNRQLTAVVYNAEGTALIGVAVSWQSADEDAATVGPTGIVTRGAGDGTALIRAFVGTVVSNTCSVAVAPEVEDTVPASVVIAPISITLATGQSRQLSAVVYNAAGVALTGVAVTWASDDTTAAAVNSTGIVTRGTGTDTAHITASVGAIDSNICSVAALIVQEVLVPTTITIEPTTLSLIVGESQQLAAVVYDQNGGVLTGVAVAWRSDNNAAASVSSTGIVTRGSGDGTAHIHASVGDVDSNVCSVAPATSDISRVPATVTILDSDFTLRTGETRQLTAVVRNSTGELLVGVPLTWSSDNSSVAGVGLTGIVTAGALGTAQIRAFAGSIASAPVDATVIAAVNPVVFIEVTPTSFALVADGTPRTVQLTGVLKDGSGQTISGSPTGWQSDNTAVARVDSSGLVTGFGAGSCQIRAVYVSGSTSAVSPAVLVDVTVIGGSPDYPNEPGSMTVLTPLLTCDVQPPTTSEWVEGSANDIGWLRINTADKVTDLASPIGSTNVLETRFPAGAGGGGSPVNVYSRGPGATYNPQFWPQHPTYLYQSLWYKVSENFPASLVANKLVYSNLVKATDGSTTAENILFMGASADYSLVNGVATLTPGMATPYNAVLWPHLLVQNGISVDGVIKNSIPLHPNVVGSDPTNWPQMIRGRWHRLEWLTVANSAGAEDGTAKMWMDGVLLVDFTNRVKWSNTADFWSTTSWTPVYNLLVPADAVGAYHHIKHFYVSGKV